MNKSRHTNYPTYPVVELITLSAASTRGVLQYGSTCFNVALGRTGIVSRKREGDGGTPQGKWFISKVLYRPDRSKYLQSCFAVQQIRPCDGWCDEPLDRNYNRMVAMPYSHSAEHMWRRDHLYDIVVVLNYNIAPRMKYAGSAIFMHIARKNFAPTAGCIAMKKTELIKFLQLLKPHSAISVRSNNRPYYRGRRGLR